MVRSSAAAKVAAPAPGTGYPGTHDVPEHAPVPGPAATIALAPAAPAPRADHDSTIVAGPTFVQGLDQLIAEATYHGLARATGLSRSHITGILKGRRNCTVRYADKLAGSLGVSTSDLLDYAEAKRVALAAAIFAGKEKGSRKRR
jgi:hypothetical protein